MIALAKVETHFDDFIRKAEGDTAANRKGIGAKQLLVDRQINRPCFKPRGFSRLGYTRFARG